MFIHRQHSLLVKEATNPHHFWAAPQVDLAGLPEVEKALGQRNSEVTGLEGRAVSVHNSCALELQENSVRPWLRIGPPTVLQQCLIEPVLAIGFFKTLLEFRLTRTQGIPVQSPGQPNSIPWGLVRNADFWDPPPTEMS